MIHKNVDLYQQQTACLAGPAFSTFVVIDGRKASSRVIVSRYLASKIALAVVDDALTQQCPKQQNDN